MRLSFVYAICLFCLAVLTPIVGLCDELEERATVINNVVTAVRQGEFRRLEDLSSEYRASQARTSSGLWKLTLFYAGLQSVFDTHRRDSAFWLSAQDSVEDWLKRYPQSPTAHLAYAQMLLNRGWSFRGDGYASTVEPQDWQPFREYTQQARRYLEANKEIASQDPRWYEMMVIIAYRQSWSQPEFANLLNEGLSRYPSFYQLYFSAIDYLAPKWGGSAVSIDAFARDAQKRTQVSEGYGMYARIYWYASQTQYDNSLFSDSLVDWPLMKKGIDDVLAKYPDAWNINYFARFACLARDKVKTAELIRRVHSSPLIEAWGDMRTYLRCKEWSGDGSSDAQPLVPRDRRQAALTGSLRASPSAGP